MANQAVGWNSGDIFERSPDGKHSAEVRDASEVAMGGPTGGRLFVDGQRVLGIGCEDLHVEDFGFSPSFVWSDDSRFLFLHAWGRTLKRAQHTKIAVFDLERFQLHILHKARGLGYELTRFSNGTLWNGNRSINLAKIMGPEVFGADDVDQCERPAPPALRIDGDPKGPIADYNFRDWGGVRLWLTIILAAAFAAVGIILRTI